MNRPWNINTLKLLNWVGFMLTIAVNALAELLPFNNTTMAELSAQYPNLFTPATFAFSIWGVIYLSLLLFCLCQTGILGPKGFKDDSVICRIGPLFLVASVINGLWLLAWHYELVGVSMVLMIALLVTLITIYRRIAEKPLCTWRETWFVKVPFSLYLGWISVATVANAAALLVHLGWGRWGIPEEIWTVIMIAVAVLLGLYMLLWRQDAAFALVVLWALLGIFVRHTAEFDGQYQSVILSTSLGMLILAAGAVYMLLQRARQKKK